MRYPTRSDMFGMQSVVDYKRLIEMQAGKSKVTGSKKVFAKKENHNTKTRMHRMQNK